MTLRIEPVTRTVEAAPGGDVEVLFDIHNGGDRVETIFASPVGIDVEPDHPWFDQRFQIEPHATTRAAVRIPIPATIGIGEHAIGVQVTQPGVAEPLLVRLTVSIASVQKVDLRTIPSQVGGRRSAKFSLEIVNNEAHPVQIDLESNNPAVRVRFANDRFALRPGERAEAAGRARVRTRLTGETVQHNVQLIGRGTASMISTNLPFLQRPVLARGLRSMVVAVTVIALGLGAIVGAHEWILNRDTGSAGSVPAVGAGESTDGQSGGGQSGDGGSNGGQSGNRADSSTPDSSGTDQSGVDAGSADAGSLDSGLPASPRGSSTGDSSTGGSVGASTTSGPSTSGPTDSTGAPSMVVVRGTVDLDGSLEGIVITPTAMTLADVAERNPVVPSAFGSSRPLARKIWSARWVQPVSPRVAQSEPIPAGPFGPDSNGIWAVELQANQTYELAFRKQGYEVQSFVVSPELGKQTELDVDLEPATGQLGGLVTGRGRGLENVRVLVTDGLFDYETVTDGNGEWGLSGVASGVLYTILATLDGFGADVKQERLEPGVPRTDINLNLKSGETVLSGSVIDKVTRLPLPGVAVTAINGTETRATTTLTDGARKGSFSIPQLAAGQRYSVTAALRGYRTATTSARLSAGATSLAPIELEPLAASLNGIVVDSATGAGITGAGVKLTSDSAPAPVASVQTVNEGAVGSFALGNVPPGRYLLTVEHWQHATIRHVLVVESATTSTLDPDDPVSSQSGPNFTLSMAPIDTTPIGDRPTGNLSLRIRDRDETRECPLTAGGLPRPAEQCSAIFSVTVQVRTTDPVFTKAADAGTGLFVKGTEEVIDPQTGKSMTQPYYAFNCSPAVECNSGENFPDYTISNIPVGTYTVKLTHPDYNPRTISVTIRPDVTQKETVNMARLGDVVGSVIDSSRLPAVVPIPASVLIRNVANQNLVYETRPIDGTFQTRDDRRLPPGTYRVEVTAFELGYFIDQGQDVDANATTAAMTFTIGVPDPDNPAPSRVELRPILADPYPELTTRVFTPTAIDPLAFAPIDVGPDATMTCAGEAPSPVPAEILNGTIRFSKVLVAGLDASKDGVLSGCTMSISATGFSTFTYTFGGTNGAGTPIEPLRLKTDRFLDVAMLRVPADPQPIRQARGTLSWIDAGNTQSPSRSLPIQGATVTASNVITALVPSDGVAPPTAGAPSSVTAFAPSLAPVVTAYDRSTTPPQAVWDFGAGVQHLIGEARYRIEAENFVGGTLFVTIDPNGVQTTRVEMDPAIVDDNDLTDGRFDIVLEPNPGTLTGRTTIYTSDPNPRFGQIAVVAALNPSLTTSATPDETTGVYSVGADAGTWLTTVTAPAHHRVIDASAEELTRCLPPGETSPSQVVLTASTAVFRQCVPPGRASPSATVTLVELGSMEVVVKSSGGNIDASTNPIVYQFDGGISTTSVSSTLRFDDLSVPTSEDPPDYPTPPNVTETHTLRISSAGRYDPTLATVTLFRLLNPSATNPTPTPTDPIRTVTNLTAGFPVEFEPGAKYQLEVTLPSFGSVTGTIPASDRAGNQVPICTQPDATPPTEQAVVTGVPVVSSPNFPFVYNVDPSRPNITTSTCGAFTLFGRQGLYDITVTHPEFVSSHASFTGDATFVIEVPGNDAVVPLVAPLPALTLRPSAVDVQAVKTLGGEPATDAYFVIERNGIVISGPAPVTVGAEMLADPGTGYLVRVRSCLTDPGSDSAAFDRCVERFPAMLGFEVPRSRESRLETVVLELPLLEVGGKIDVNLRFENARDRPVCPLTATVTVGRTYTDQIVGRNNGTTVVLDADPSSRTESHSTVFVDDNQLRCLTDDGIRSLLFDRLIPTGTHRLSLPLVAGFKPPTLTFNGSPITPVGTGSDPLEFDVTVSSISTRMIAAVTYEANPVDVSVYVCGEGANGCGERFPTLVASLTEPGPLGASVPGAVAPRDRNLGYLDTFANVQPDAESYTLGIIDRLHRFAQPQPVLVEPGPQNPPASYRFAGSDVRVAIKVLLSNDGSQPPIPGQANVSLLGRRSSTSAWIFISDTPAACTIDTDAGPATYLCFEDATTPQFTDYLVRVEKDSYVTAERTYLGLPRGTTTTDEITIKKRARLQVNVVAIDSSGQPTALPATLFDLVSLVRDVGGTAGIDRIPPITGVCVPSGGCFQFYADPEISYHFETGPTANYFFAKTDPILAAIGAARSVVLTVLLRPSETRISTVPSPWSGIGCGSSDENR